MSLKKTSEAAIKKNRELVCDPMRRSRKLTDRFKQEEAALIMRKLYKDLNYWLKEHYSRPLTEKFSILARFMVGLNESFGDHLYHIEKEIKKTYTFAWDLYTAI